MTLSQKNFDKYREYRAFAQPDKLHELIAELLEAHPYRVTITPLTVFDPDLGLGPDDEPESLEYWVKAQFAEKEVFE